MLMCCKKLAMERGSCWRELWAPDVWRWSLVLLPYPHPVSVSCKDSLSPEWPVQRRSSLYNHSTPLHPKPNQHLPSSPRATRLRAHSAFLLRRFFLDTPLSGRPAEDFTSHVPFDRFHLIGPLLVTLIHPPSNLLSQSTTQYSDTSRINNY